MGDPPWRPCHTGTLCTSSPTPRSPGSQLALGRCLTAPCNLSHSAITCAAWVEVGFVPQLTASSCRRMRTLRLRPRAERCPGAAGGAGLGTARLPGSPGLGAGRPGPWSWVGASKRQWVWSHRLWSHPELTGSSPWPLGAPRRARVVTSFPLTFRWRARRLAEVQGPRERLLLPGQGEGLCSGLHTSFLP